MKKKGGKKKQKRIGYRIIIPSFLLFSIIIVATLFFLYLRNLKSDHTAVVFEESYKYVTDLQKKITEVEKAIYDALYSSDITDKDILFSAVLPRHKKGYEWEFTELTVHYPKDKPDNEIQRIIEQALIKLYPSVQYNTEKKSRDKVVFNIYALGFYTHRINLIKKARIIDKTKGKPRIAIIIDDLGYDIKKAAPFINFEPKLSLSVLPQAPYAQEIAKLVLKEKRDLLLHLPMEPKNYPHINPGPGTLLTSMSDEQLSRELNLQLNSIKGIVGVNNHMGSVFTERRDKMSIVLKEIGRRDLFFIDSRTTAKSVAFDLAGSMGIPTAKRSVFIDNDLSPEAIKYQIERLIGLARHSSGAIGIAHPHQMTLDIFREYQTRFRNEIKLVPVSEIVH